MITESRWMPLIPHPFSQQPLSAWILQLQQGKSSEDRLRALQAVGLLATPTESASAAAGALQDADPGVRALAAKLLGGAGVVSSEAELAILVADEDPDVCFEAARALIRLKSVLADRAIPVLLAFMDETETQPLMVAAIVNTLVELDSTTPIGEGEFSLRLQKLLDHDRAEVREAVSTAFAKWPAMAKPLIGELLPLLDDSEPIVREKIACAIGGAGVVNDAVCAALEAASQDEDTEVARAAAEALGKIRP
jgi:HEAT repeat protein